MKRKKNSIKHGKYLGNNYGKKWVNKYKKKRSFAPPCISYSKVLSISSIIPLHILLK
nr:MAG TPA: hypothetical protein [Caudoviricetes sp.]